MDVGNSVSRQVDFLQLGREAKESGWQLLDQVPTQDENFEFLKSIKGLIGDLTNFIALQSELEQNVLVLKRPVSNVDYLVVAQVHLDQAVQESVSVQTMRVRGREGESFKTT